MTESFRSKRPARNSAARATALSQQLPKRKAAYDRVKIETAVSSRGQNRRDYSWWALPNLTDLICGLHHRLSRFARKCFRELRHIHHHAIDAVFCRRVWIGDGANTEVLRTLIRARPLGKADEESLIGSKGIDGMKLLVFCRIFPGNISQNLATQVRDIFT